MDAQPALAPPAKQQGRTRPWFFLTAFYRGGWIAALVVPLVSVGAITGINFVLSDLIAIKNISMLYLAAVVLSAVVGGGLSAMLAAALSFLAYNYFFIEPRTTFTVGHPDELLALLMFVVVALVTGSLAAQMRAQAAAARDQARATQELYEFSRALTRALSLDAVGDTIVKNLSVVSNCTAVLLLPDDRGMLEVQSASSPEASLSPDIIRSVQQVYDSRGDLMETSANAPALRSFYLLTSGLRRLGIVLLSGAGAAEAGNRSRHFEAMLEQAAVAIDRALWARESAAAAVAREAQKLESALLSSLSHDLKTPLASITGAATSLRQLGGRMDEATRNDLLQSIAEDAGRLNRFVGNLFDMTRIESGGLRIRREAVDLAEIVDRASRRAQELYPGLPIDLKIAADLPPGSGDALLIEQALFNILDNARKYAGPDRSIAVHANASNDTVRVSITDQGPGIPQDDLERIFDKFYRRTKGDGRPAGTGLGLSIARGFISAMGGSIRAESPIHGRRGTRFVVTLPIMRIGR